ncbi:hypothetical protein K2Z84_32850 [Candidatus Binatia bacterium]|jgi:hypothetical protein|nr:hypothetical protein [Candidatus Binatia bacterium]
MRPARSLAIVTLLVAALGCGDASTSGVDAKIDALFGAPPFGTVNRTEARRILETKPEDDGPFYMVNFIHHREHAEYRDGRPTELTGAEADALYNLLVLPMLADIGAQPFYVGGVERTLLPGDGQEWDQIAVVLYASRAKFIEMISRPDFHDAAAHKVAGVERTIVLVTHPAPDQLPEDLRRVDLAKLPFPPTADDQPINLVHLIRFNETAQYADGRPTTLTGREAFDLYEQGRVAQALPLGVRPAIKLDVEAELIGDGRGWDEVRINNFPSRAAFAELTTRESLDAAGYENRVAGLADTYALLAAPIVNQVGYLPPREP